MNPIRTDIIPKINSQYPVAAGGNMLAQMWGWIRRDTTSTDWLIVILTAVIAGTSYLQWHEIRSGGQDTRDLAVAAGKQADRTKDLVDQMKLQAGATHDLAVAAGKQADASRGSF